MAPLFSITRKRKICRFNRTHYENVLVTRVHPEYILNENLPGLEDVSLITPLGKIGIRILRNTLPKWNYCAEILYISVKKSRAFIEAFRRKHNWKFSVEI
jgi:hypothetical protein